MQARIDFQKAAPEGFKLLLAFQPYFKNQPGLEPALLNLVFVRASQINGCAPCIDMHTKDARALGETEQRLYGLSAWREAPFYTDREQAALAWTEAVTLVSETHVPDEVFEVAREHFTDKELANLTLAITQINTWNRLNVAFRTVAGSYKPEVEQMKRSA